MAFGSNLGKRIKNLKAGIVLCQEELLFLATSHWKVTKPLSHRDYDIRNHGSYVNFVADVSSALSPTDLHSLTFSVEKKIGHSNKGKWLPRHLDIDILFVSKNWNRDFSQCPAIRVALPHLTIPHPAYFQRGFLIEMVETDLGIQTEKHFTKGK